MKAIILLGTLKKDTQSNTQVLSEFFTEHLAERGVKSEVVRLVDYRILPGTSSDMGEGDAWPAVFQKVLDADIVIFATPIWWGTYSSEIQRVIERLDAVHDDIMQGKPSPLEGKVGGIIITGASDGAEHIIGMIANFFGNIGLSLPPFASLSVLWSGHEKGNKLSRDELLEKYKEEYTDTARTMVKQLMSSCEKR